MKGNVITGAYDFGQLGGAQNVDFSGFSYAKLTLTADAVLAVRNVKPGQIAWLELVQDVTGGRKVSFSTGTNIITVSTPSSWQPAAAPNASTVVMLVGNQLAGGTAKLVATADDGGDEVSLSPSGVDDTAAILAVCQASKVAVLGPPGARYFVNGSAFSLAQVNCGGIRLMPRVEVRPTAGWVPAIGAVDDPTNVFFQAKGVAGAYSSTTPSIQRRGSRDVIGIVSTAGLAAGMWVQLKASPTGGRTLPEDREIAQVASVLDANTIRLASPLRLNYGNSYNTLPVLITSITPVESFFVECGPGAFFNTLGRNIAGVVFVDSAFAAPGGAGAVTTGVPRSLRLDKIAAMGCTRSMVNLFNTTGVVVPDLYSAGLNNGGLFQQCSHQTDQYGFKSSPNGPHVAATGPTRCMIWSEAGGSDNHFHDNDFTNVAGGVHPLGGYSNRVSRLKSFGIIPDIRFTRDPGQAGLYLGALIDMYVNPGTNEPTMDLVVDGACLCGETYVDAVARPIAADRGVHSFVFVDVFGLVVSGSLVTDNIGNGTQPLNGANVDPCGGTMLFDNFNGRHIETIGGRNNAGGCVSTNLAGFGGTIGTISYEVRAGISTDPQSADAILLGSSGPNTSPRIARLFLANGGNAVQSNAAFLAAIDYNFTIGEVWNQASGTLHRCVVPALNPGPITYVACDVAALNPATAAATRGVVEAAADAESPVIVAQNTNTGIAFVALGGGSVNTAGAVSPVSLLTAEGGATHRAKVNPAATFSTLLGRPMLAKGAGNAIIECRGGI